MWRLLEKVLGQFARNDAQTVKRAADNKRRYAPGRGSIALICCGGIPPEATVAVLAVVLSNLIVIALLKNRFIYTSN